MAQNDIVYSFSGPVQVYRMSVFLKIVLAVVALIVIVLFSFFLLEQYLPVSSTDKMNTFNQIFCLISVSLGFALLFAVFKYKIEVYPDKMKKVSLLGNTELPINKIQGFRTISNRGSETFVMYPKDSGVKKISIGEMMERKEDLKKWIRQSLTDLDAADYQEEMNNVLHDKVLGDTEEQRLLLLQRAKKATMFLNGIAIALSVWCMLYPRPYEILVTSLIMLPLISLGFLHYFRGTIKFYVQRQKSVYPSIATAFLFPLFVLTIKVAMGYNILNWDGFWFPFSCLSIVFYLLTLYVAKDIRHKISWVLALVIMCSG